MEQLTGQPRLAVLYGSLQTTRDSQVFDVECTRLVAIRILKVRDAADGSCHVTIQPTVISTRTAFVDAAEPPERTEVTSHNQSGAGASTSCYVYRLELTR